MTESDDLLPGQEDEAPEPGDTVIELSADGIPMIYTEPEPGPKGATQRIAIRDAGGGGKNDNVPVRAPRRGRGGRAPRRSSSPDAG